MACRAPEAAAEASLSPGSPSTSFSSDWGGDMVLDAVAQVTTDVGQLAAALPELGLKEWGAGVGRAMVGDHVAACAGALRGRVAGGVAKLAAALAAEATGGLRCVWGARCVEPTNRRSWAGQLLSLLCSTAGSVQPSTRCKQRGLGCCLGHGAEWTTARNGSAQYALQPGLLTAGCV